MYLGVPLRGARGSPAHGRRTSHHDGFPVLNRTMRLRQVETDPHLQDRPEVSVSSPGWQARSWSLLQGHIRQPCTCFHRGLLRPLSLFLFPTFPKVLVFSCSPLLFFIFSFAPTYMSVLLARSKHKHWGPAHSRRSVNMSPLSGFLLCLCPSTAPCSFPPLRRN